MTRSHDVAAVNTRWVIAASVLGSGAVFLESTVVNVALPAIGRTFGLGMAGLQWVVNGLLLTLSALMLFGGALGDARSRRSVFAAGSVAFAVASALCAVAPTLPLLVACRVLQGAAGALLVPNSLALLEEVVPPEHRGSAIGQWAGWSAISTALGPLAGGWIVQTMSWRFVFAIIVPFALGAAWLAIRHVPDTPRPPHARRSLDVLGATLATAGLGLLVWALTDGPETGFSNPVIVGAIAAGAAALAGFALVEWRSRDPLLPLALFRSRQFSGVNAATLFIYAALSALIFLFVLELQNGLGYGPLAAGASLLPVNALMLGLSPASGRLAQRIGPRIPMTAGALVAGAGILLLTRAGPGGSYVATVLPGILVFGLGLATLVAPLTSAMLDAVGEGDKGVASAVNNAVARLAGLIATAAIPLAAGLGGARQVSGEVLQHGFARAMRISAALCAAGAAIAWTTVSGKAVRD